MPDGSRGYGFPIVLTCKRAALAPTGGTAAAGRGREAVTAASTRGHRTMPHTAGLIIEAWGGTPLECLEEAARAVVETFAGVGEVTATDTVPVMFEFAPDDEEALVAVLEEIMYLVDAHEVVPVEVTLEATEDGGVACYFETVPTAWVAVSGAAPKGVSRSELELKHDQGRWRCRAVIDV
jgi:SHS2 domain-containing protein